MNHSKQLNKNILLATLSLFIFSCTANNTEQTNQIEKVKINKEKITNQAPQIVISWNDEANNEDGYIVQRRTKSSNLYEKTQILPANTETYSDTNLKAGQTYCYLISAYNKAGKSSSDEICIEI